MWKIRSVGPDDVDSLWLALEIAANWRGPATLGIPDVRNHPIARRYVDGWGRTGDDGLVAETELGEFAGACWFRLFDVDEVWGAVETGTPVLSIGVADDHRGRGLGGTLLAGVLDVARASGFQRASLSVSCDNRAAIALYEKFGFRRVGESEGSRDMVVNFQGVTSR